MGKNAEKKAYFGSEGVFALGALLLLLLINTELTAKSYKMPAIRVEAEVLAHGTVLYVFRNTEPMYLTGLIPGQTTHCPCRVSGGTKNIRVQGDNHFIF